MRAARYHEFGEPENVLRVEDLAAPAPRPGEALVRLRARPVSPSVLLTVRGRYGILPPLPAVPGAEAAGVVAAVTEGCRRFRPGDRVTVLPASLGVEGTWKELAAVAEDKLLPTPDALTDAQAATAWANYLTAWLMVTRVVPLQPGDVVVATALGSHVGRALLEIARARGFVVIGTVRAEPLVAELEALGARAVVTAPEQLGKLVNGLTGGRGARAVLDAVGGATGTSALGCLAEGGDFVAYGILSDASIEVDGAALIFRDQRVRGFWVSRWLRETPADERDAVIAELMSAFARGQFRPAVDREFPLEDVRDAVRWARRSGRHGKVVLVGP